VIFVDFGSLGGNGEEFGTQTSFELFGEEGEIVVVRGSGAIIVMDCAEFGTGYFYRVITGRGTRIFPIKINTI